MILHIYIIVGFLIAIYNQTRLNAETNWLKLKFSDSRGIDFFLSIMIGALVLVIDIIILVVLLVGLELSILYSKINKKSKADRVIRRWIYRILG